MRLIRFLSLAAALVAAPLAATAAALTVTFDNPIFGLTNDNPRSDTIKLWYRKPGSSSPTELNVNAGRFTGVASDPQDFNLGLLVDLSGANGVQFAMYCYDLDQVIGAGNIVTYSVVFDGETQRTRDFLGAVNAELNKGKATPDPYAWLQPGSALAGAAIQIGLWESLYDTSSTWSVAHNNTNQRGSFYAQNLDNGTAQWLQSFFVRLNSNQNYSPVSPDSVIVLRSSTHQDMITGDPPVEVPLPGTLSLLALGAAALLLRRRR